MGLPNERTERLEKLGKVLGGLDSPHDKLLFIVACLDDDMMDRIITLSNSICEAAGGSAASKLSNILEEN